MILVTLVTMTSSQLLLLRSIPLSRETRKAWLSNNNNLIVRRRYLNDEYVREVDKIFCVSAFLNLGNLDLDLSNLTKPVFNGAETVRAISSPMALRRTLNDYVPKFTTQDAHWHKRGSWGGDGKIFHKEMLGECATLGGDSQKHIEGTEYRVITVGDKIVQASLKEKKNENIANDIGNFNWYWIGVDGIRNSGIIPHIKSAITNIPFWPYTVFGWDIIRDSVSGMVYTIEINTSPGVNEHSVQRIMKQIERIL